MHEVCFNELAIQDKHHSLLDAFSSMDHFMTILNQLGLMLGRSYSLRIFDEFTNYEIFTGYCIQQWMNDGRVGREQRALLRSLVTKGPYIEEGFFNDHPNVMEASWQGKVSKGLLFGYIQNAMMISIDNYGKWNDSYLTIDVTNYNDTTNELITSKFNLNHAACIGNLAVHEQWIENCKKSNIQTPEALFELQGDYFPNIYFNDSCVAQIRQMSGNSAHFNFILGKLFILQHYCISTTSQILDLNLLSGLGLNNVRSESDSTLQKYSACRMFQNSQGDKELFTFHFDLNPGDWRVYIKWNSLNKNIEFGYIGKHLPTSKFA